MSNLLLYSFYKFVDIHDTHELRSKFLCLMKKWQVHGSIILASEGLNGSVCGQPQAIAAFWQEFIHDPRWQDLQPNITTAEFPAFKKAKVKLRAEIVTLGVPELQATSPEDPSHLNPDCWNQLISHPNTVIIDTRNQYEYEMGSFKNAINPQTESFREFPQFVQNNLMHHKDQPIAMYCTGGIRCEKSSAYLQQLGFKQVYQLQGGILNYLKNIPTDESLWHGQCFVFDDRISLDHDHL